MALEQREVLIVVGANGLSYEQAAKICDVEVGTIKSRLSRARSRLVEILTLDEIGELRTERNGFGQAYKDARRRQIAQSADAGSVFAATRANHGR
jgi:Sigma-70, region 4